MKVSFITLRGRLVPGGVRESRGTATSLCRSNRGLAAGPPDRRRVFAAAFDAFGCLRARKLRGPQWQADRSDVTGGVTRAVPCLV